MENILLFGGGLDSYAYSVLLSDMKVPHTLYHINYGQIAYRAEHEVIQKITNKYVNVVSSEMKVAYTDTSLLTGKFSQLNTSTAFVPGRNLYFILNVVEYIYRNNIKDANIILGFTDPGYEPMPDATNKFINCANVLMGCCFNDVNIKISAPLINCTRKNVVYAAYYLDNNIFDNCMTCWVPIDNKPCNKCPHCLALKEIKEYCKNLHEAYTKIQYDDRSNGFVTYFESLLK